MVQYIKKEKENNKMNQPVYMCPVCSEKCVGNEICSHCGTKRYIIYYSDDLEIRRKFNQYYNNHSPKNISYLPDIEKLLDEMNMPHNFDKEKVQGLIDREKKGKQEYEKYVKKHAQRTGVPLGTVITCPYCKSTNVQKIGLLNRTFSTGLFGLGSSKVGKQWHCNNCKSDF